MKAEVYNPEKHQEQISKWLTQWELPQHNLEVLPPTGLIVDNIAAIFVYLTNAKICFLEGLISNREINKEIRDETADYLCKEILTYSKQCGFEYVASYSSNPKVVKRAENLFFNVNPATYKCFVRNLEGVIL